MARLAHLRSGDDVNREESISAQAFLESRMKECYYNAQRFALAFDGIRYFEGFASAIIPVEHAWIVNDRGEIIETTWPVSGEYPPLEYYGIEIPTDAILAKWETGYAGQLLWDFLRR
jgi:hypothetical protein